MFRHSPGMRLAGFAMGCVFTLGAIEILGRGNPDEYGMVIGCAAIALIGFSTLFSRYG